MSGCAPQPSALGYALQLDVSHVKGPHVTRSVASHGGRVIVAKAGVA
jgi:hypothetical protein